MLNYKKRTKSLIPLLTCFVIFSTFLFVNNAYATYTSASLSPSSGTIGNENTKIDLIVNSGTDSFIGIDLDLSFTGPVSFVQGTGNGCTFTPKTMAVNVECFNFEDQPYNGPVASLYFVATGEGQTAFSLTNVDPAVTNISGGQYSLTITSVGSDTELPTSLPSTGITDNRVLMILFGTVFLIFGLFLPFIPIPNKSLRKEDFEKRLLNNPTKN